MNTRYYDPVTGRFISADGYLSTGQGLLGYNMYAYCNNNPVMLTDSLGSKPKWLEKFKETAEEIIEQIAVQTIIVTFKVAQDVINYDKDNTDPQKMHDANYFSSYNGNPVVVFNSDMISTFAFGGTIFYNKKRAPKNFDNSVNYAGVETTLKHESGHLMQEKELGTLKYTVAIFIPSATYNLVTTITKNKLLEDNYYNMPWEYSADVFGGVSRSQHSSWAPVLSAIYWEVITR